MSAISIFSFENSELRTSGTPESPLFVATDLAAILGYSNVRKAIYTHVDPEDLIKSEIETNGGRQLVNCVNESGLYALIFGSKLPSAKRFKRWVTSEVLPAIRKSGRYAVTEEKISSAQQFEIRKAVKSRAKNCSVHYQTIYNAVYERYRVPSYKELSVTQYENALFFIRSFELGRGLVPEIGADEKILILRGDEAERIARFVYFWRYYFRSNLEMILRLLQLVDSPKTALFYESLDNLHLPLLEASLERQGFSVKSMDCYQCLMASRR